MIQDRLRKFVILILIKERKADIVKDKLRELFLTFGFPKKLVIDRRFSSKNLKALLQEKRSDTLKRVSPVAPRVNGEAENKISYVLDIIHIIKRSIHIVNMKKA